MATDEFFIGPGVSSTRPLDQLLLWYRVGARRARCRVQWSAPHRIARPTLQPAWANGSRFVTTVTPGDGRPRHRAPFDAGGDAFSVAVAAAPGDQIACDWFDLAPGATSGETPAAPGTIISTAAPVDEAIVGGLGLSRAEWEAAHGAAELTDTNTPPYRPLNQYERGIFYVQFSGEGDDANPIIYIEQVFPDDGVELPFVEGKVRELLSDDVELSEAFYLPRTPGGPSAQRVFQGTSQAIAAAFPSAPAPNILVVFFERARDPHVVGARESPDTIVRASLAVRVDAP